MKPHTYFFSRGLLCRNRRSSPKCIVVLSKVGSIFTLTVLMILMIYMLGSTSPTISTTLQRRQIINVSSSFSSAIFNERGGGRKDEPSARAVPGYTNSKYSKCEVEAARRLLFNPFFDEFCPTSSLHKQSGGVEEEELRGLFIPPTSDPQESKITSMNQSRIDKDAERRGAEKEEEEKDMHTYYYRGRDSETAIREAIDKFGFESSFHVLEREYRASLRCMAAELKSSPSQHVHDHHHQAQPIVEEEERAAEAFKSCTGSHSDAQRLGRAQEEALTPNLPYITPDPIIGERNVLFVDGRERCEAYEGFLLKVRRSGFKGLIVLLLYYEEDTFSFSSDSPLAFEKEIETKPRHEATSSRCVAEFAAPNSVFQPLQLFTSFSVPRHEPRLMIYHALRRYLTSSFMYPYESPSDNPSNTTESSNMSHRKKKNSEQPPPLSFAPSPPSLSSLPSRSLKLNSHDKSSQQPHDYRPVSPLFLFDKAAIVHPESVWWCSSSNPFDDVPLPLGHSLYTEGEEENNNRVASDLKGGSISEQGGSLDTQARWRLERHLKLYGKAGMRAVTDESLFGVFGQASETFNMGENGISERSQHGLPIETGSCMRPSDSGGPLIDDFVAGTPKALLGLANKILELVVDTDGRWAKHNENEGTQKGSNSETKPIVSPPSAISLDYPIAPFQLFSRYLVFENFLLRFWKAIEHYPWFAGVSISSKPRSTPIRKSGTQESFHHAPSDATYAGDLASYGSFIDGVKGLFGPAAQAWREWRVQSYVAQRAVHLEPRQRYGVADCLVYLPDDFDNPSSPSSCYRCDADNPDILNGKIKLDTSVSTHSLVVGTLRCSRRVTSPTPNYTPFCTHPYRRAVLEVPRDMSLEGYAYDHILAGARSIRDEPRHGDIFTEEEADPLRIVDTHRNSPPSAAVEGGVRSPLSMSGGRAKRKEASNGRDVSNLRSDSECPHGVLGVLTMMAGYDITYVRSFIGSFLHYGHARCTKMVMMISPGTPGLERLAQLFPDRIEFVYITGAAAEAARYTPKHLTKANGCEAADARFEVAQLWLEANYRRFGFIMSTDSRDFMFLSDPYARLVSLLRDAGYTRNQRQADKPPNASDVGTQQLVDEFIASVAEHYTAGGESYPLYAANVCIRRWTRKCGKCYRKFSRSTSTAATSVTLSPRSSEQSSFVEIGEPLPVLNSGHVIGTATAMLHYYRFHVRMVVESGHKCDGSDQGLFTYYFYGMLQEAGFPHKILIFIASLSGFTNNAFPLRMSRRVVRVEEVSVDGVADDRLYIENDSKSKPSQTTTEKRKEKKNTIRKRPTARYAFEYFLTDCNNNTYAGLHQFDRFPQLHYELMETNPSVNAPWQPWEKNNTFWSTFLDGDVLSTYRRRSEKANSVRTKERNEPYRIMTFVAGGVALLLALLIWMCSRCCNSVDRNRVLSSKRKK